MKTITTISDVILLLDWRRKYKNTDMILDRSNKASSDSYISVNSSSSTPVRLRVNVAVNIAKAVEFHEVGIKRRRLVCQSEKSVDS